MMRVAVDAMGGDIGPSVVVPGAIEGARTAGVSLTLVGQPVAIEAALRGADASGVDIGVTEAPDVIGMGDHPVQAIRQKPGSSISVALRDVKAGRAAAMVSAGNSGAVMAAALLELGRVPGIDRPALASMFPTVRGQTMVLDLGAVTDPKPHHLVQFALMGHVYAVQILGIAKPVVGLLSNGEEPTKGNRLVQETFPLLAATPGITFRGNVEGKDIPLGSVDVVVADGFTGNIALKVAEGVASMLTTLLREELTATLPRKAAAFTLRNAFRALKAKLDYSEIGGAPLIGVNGTVIIAHGRSDAKAISNAVRVAATIARSDLPQQVRAVFADSLPDSRRVEPAETRP